MPDAPFRYEGAEAAVQGKRRHIARRRGRGRHALDPHDNGREARRPHRPDGRQRVADGQLDEAPLTFEDLAKIKNSFTFTLLNMLHSRVAYSAPAEPPNEANA